MDLTTEFKALTTPWPVGENDYITLGARIMPSHRQASNITNTFAWITLTNSERIYDSATLCVSEKIFAQTPQTIFNPFVKNIIIFVLVYVSGEHNFL